MTRRVVVVDDEADIREIAALSLETMQGWQAWRCLRRRGLEAGPQQPARPLDVMMPGRTVRRPRRPCARRRDRAVPVVFLTAKAQVREKAQLQDLGAAGVLAKPFDPTTLGDDLAALLGW